MVWIVKLPPRSVTNIQVKIGGMFECLELSKKSRVISLLTLCTQHLWKRMWQEDPSYLTYSRWFDIPALGPEMPCLRWIITCRL